MKHTHRAIIGAAIAGIVLAIVPALSAPADAATRYRCEETRTGRVCAMMHTPAKGSKLAAESRKFKSWRYLPMDNLTTVVYKGYASRDLENGRDVWTVRSRVHRNIWHTYTVRAIAKCAPFDTAAAKASESIVYPEYAPKCRGYVWTLAASDLPEDAYGWNCWIDGNGDCGDAGTETADGCLSFSADRYTMCRDGRVYLIQGMAHVAELRRITP